MCPGGAVYGIEMRHRGEFAPCAGDRSFLWAEFAFRASVATLKEGSTSPRTPRSPLQRQVQGVFLQKDGLLPRDLTIVEILPAFVGQSGVLKSSSRGPPITGQDVQSHTEMPEAVSLESHSGALKIKSQSSSGFYVHL